MRSTKKDSDQTQLCKLCVILRSRVLRGVYTPREGYSRLLPCGILYQVAFGMAVARPLDLS